MHLGHFGVKRMIQKINTRFYWIGIVKDCQEWASSIFSFLATILILKSALDCPFHLVPISTLFIPVSNLHTLSEIREGEDCGSRAEEHQASCTLVHDRWVVQLVSKYSRCNLAFYVFSESCLILCCSSLFPIALGTRCLRCSGRTAFGRHWLPSRWIGC